MGITLRPGKASLMAGLYVGLMVIAPYTIYSAIAASGTNIPLPSSFFTMLMLSGILSAVAAFFKSLFEEGSRLHGLCNVIFAAWFTYNLYFVLGGGLGTGGFGNLVVVAGYYTIAINVSFLAYIVIAIGIVSIIVHVYELIA